MYYLIIIQFKQMVKINIPERNSFFARSYINLKLNFVLKTKEQKYTLITYHETMSLLNPHSVYIKYT